MKIEHVLNCSFHKWYENFKHLSIKSKIIPIDDEVLKYLRSNETFILPESCHYKKSAKKPVKKDGLYDSDDSETAINSDDDFGEVDNQETKKFNFPEFDAAIVSTLSSFNGKAFIKLNWSSAKDAYWSLNKLSCESLRDAYILMHSSDFISHDLNEPFDRCDENSESEKKAAFEALKYSLVVRKWVDVNPSGEFRCFVKNNKLIGISQRDCRTYYKYINENKDKITQLIKEFYNSNIHGKFHDSSFTFDIYVRKNDSILLVDFNPFGEVTDSLLFDWNEDLMSLNNADDVIFRHVQSEQTNTVIDQHPYSLNQVPKDFVDIMHGGDTEKLLDLVKMQIEMQKKEVDE